jgi:hypothetical protein
VISKISVSGMTLHFGSNDVRRLTNDFPCKVWRVMETYDGEVDYELIKLVALSVRADRREATREAAVRKGGRGWSSRAKAQWVEVRPEAWSPFPEEKQKPKTVLRKGAK